MGCSCHNKHCVDSLNEPLRNPSNKPKTFDAKIDNNEQTNIVNIFNSLEIENKNENFTIVSKIGGGGFGKTFVVKNKKNDLFILKLTDNKKKFTIAAKESELLQKCYHPNIIHYKEIFKKKNENNSILNINLIIEYANGGDLHDKLNQQINGTKYFEENILINWLMQISLGLSYLHKKIIIHRDIKPENILLLKNGLIKICDFGLSRQYKNKSELSKKSTLAGTYCYISPEMKTNNIYNEKTDIYSLGQTFYNFIRTKKDIYSSNFINLVKSLTENDQELRPSADKILENPIVKEQMKSFLDKYDYKNSMAYKIMENLKKNEKIKNISEDQFIMDVKNEWDSLFNQKENINISDFERRNNRDLDILMCIINKKLNENKNNIEIS